jgi:hypothetical protein
MECRLMAVIETKSDCGCETKLTTSSSDDPFSSPAHQHHLKNYTEEYFDHNLHMVSSIQWYDDQNYNSTLHQLIAEGYCKAIFQPPQA